MRGIRLALLLLFPLTGALTTHAFVRTMGSSGRPLAWPSPSLLLQGNPANQSGLGEAELSSLLSASFQAWSVPGSRVSISYVQSSGVPVSGAHDGVNSAYFSTATGQQMDWGVVALTSVLYYVSSGIIAETDMVFNDRQYRFTGREGDTGSSIGGKTAIFLRDVATHEAGHAIGLDHSLVNQSSLAYTAFSGQFSLSNDDKAAARTLYPGGSGASLSGNVQGTKGGIFGAHLIAIELESGKVEAGTLSSSDGSFRIGDLPAGKYAVMVEPFGVDISSVSPYFSNVSHRFCGYSLFRRRFYSACGSGGELPVLTLNDSASLNLGVIAPSCSAMGNPGGAPSSIARAKEIGSGGGAAFGTLRPGETHYYRLRNFSGSLNARAMSYSLYSPVDVRLRLLDASGAVIPGSSSTDNVQSPGPGNVVNFDAAASADSLPGADYLIEVSASGSRIPASKYSSGYELLDYDGHYLLAVSSNGSIAGSASTDMGACVSVQNVLQAASFKDAPAEQKSRERSSGCGTLSSGSGGGPFSSGMMQVLLLAGVFQLVVFLRRHRERLPLVRRRH